MLIVIQMLEINLRYVANLQYVSQQATACVSLYFMNKRAPFPPQSWTELEATGNKYPRTRSFILPDYSWQNNTHLPPTPEQRYQCYRKWHLQCQPRSARLGAPEKMWVKMKCTAIATHSWVLLPQQLST